MTGGKETFIPFPSPIIKGTFIKREKRFLAYMTLKDGTETIAHCPNTGTMRTCLLEGAPTLLWESDNPKRKYPLGWKAILINGHWIGIDTLLPNKLAALAIKDGLIPPLAEYITITPEQKISEGSRIDLLLTGEGLPDCYVEVKNVTLVEGGVARFPDAVTTRGKKHLEELVKRVKAGDRAAGVYLVQRGDGLSFTAADDIDPEYGKVLRWARAEGVEIYALGATVSEAGVTATGLLPVDL